VGSAPDPAGLAYITPPNLLAVFKGPTSKQRERKGREMRKGGEKGRERKERGGERPYAPPVANSWLRRWEGQQGYEKHL